MLEPSNERLSKQMLTQNVLDRIKKTATTAVLAPVATHEPTTMLSKYGQLLVLEAGKAKTIDVLDGNVAELAFGNPGTPLIYVTDDPICKLVASAA
jgi:hypothetical protein